MTTATHPLHDSVGFVEVHGLAASLVVADVMIKAANVVITGIESNALGGMGVKVTGSTADVRASVLAGWAVAEQMHAGINHTDWPHYSPQADFLVHSKQEYNPLLNANDHLLPAGDTAPAEDALKGTERHMAQQDAIGLIETQGLIGLLEAADVMLKAANVEVIGKEKIGAAYVTVMVKGDVAAVKAAVEAGAAAVNKLGGKLILAHVIPRPHEGLTKLLPA
jgi:carbon dioxide concentrating mechanism protein CcmO